MSTPSRHRCSGCGAEPLPPFFEARDIPALVCVLHPDEAAARACTRGDIELVLCPGCGLIENRAFDPAGVVYGEGYENALHFSEFFQGYIRGFAEELVERHGLVGGRVQEIGCGDGDRMQTYAPFLSESVRGVEPDPRAVRVACERGLDVHQGTAEDLPDAIRDRRYDLIAFVHVLEHTLDPVLSLKNAGALLNAGGIMSIEVPNNACHGARMMGEAWRWLDVPRHLNFFTPDSLAACAEAAGLTVRAVLYRGYVRQFMPDWLVDEARIGAELQGRKASKADIDRQVRHSLRLFARTALAKPAQKYDSVRVLCSRA